MRWLLARSRQYRVQVGDDLLWMFAIAACIAPAQASAVIRADTREFRDVRLHKPPVKRELSEARLEYDGRLPAAGAMQVNLAPPISTNFPGASTSGVDGCANAKAVWKQKAIMSDQLWSRMALLPNTTGVCAIYHTRVPTRLRGRISTALLYTPWFAEWSGLLILAG
jgi:hypothetical protein